MFAANEYSVNLSIAHAKTSSFSISVANKLKLHIGSINKSRFLNFFIEYDKNEFTYHAKYGLSVEFSSSLKSRAAEYLEIAVLAAKNFDNSLKIIFGTSSINLISII